MAVCRADEIVLGSPFIATCWRKPGAWCARFTASRIRQNFLACQERSCPLLLMRTNMWEAVEPSLAHLDWRQHDQRSVGGASNYVLFLWSSVIASLPGRRFLTEASSWIEDHELVSFSMFFLNNGRWCSGFWQKNKCSFSQLQWKILRVYFSSRGENYYSVTLQCTRCVYLKLKNAHFFTSIKFILQSACKRCQIELCSCEWIQKAAVSSSQIFQVSFLYTC
jgi:hypothetical protein